MGTTLAQPRMQREQPAIQPWSMWTVHTQSSFTLLTSAVDTAWTNHSSLPRILPCVIIVLAFHKDQVLVVYFAVLSLRFHYNNIFGDFIIKSPLGDWLPWLIILRINLYLYFISSSYLVRIADGIVCDISSCAADVCLQWQQFCYSIINLRIDLHSHFQCF